jgi:hypothetical protein
MHRPSLCNMVNIVPLSVADHGDLGWRSDATQIVSKEIAKVPVALDELQALGLHIPILLHVTGDLAEPVFPVKVVKQQMPSLFAPDGRWRPPVVPFFFQGGPFQIVPSPKGDLVMVDPLTLVSAEIAENGVIPLFENGTDMHPTTKRHLSRLKAWRQSRIEARQAAGSLLRAGCLRPWRKDKGPLHIVDAEKLDGLPARIAGPLHEVGALRLAHLSLVSLGVLDMPSYRAAEQSDVPAANDDPFLRSLREGFA